MKGIRMAALGAALVLGVSATVSAQDAVARGGGARGGGRGGIGMLMTDITVTPEVQTKIQEIVTKYQAQTREITVAAMQTTAGDAGAAAAAAGGARGGRGMQLDAESQKKVDELNAKRNAEIGALLTVEQKAQFEKNLATVAAGRRGGGAGGGARGNAPPPPPPPPVR